MSQPYDVPLPFDPGDLQPVCVCTDFDIYGHEPDCVKSPWYHDIHDYVWEGEDE